MELWCEILYRALITEICGNECSSKKSLKEALDSECYNALEKIKRIVEDDSLDDPECFMKIEEIVRTLEALGSSGGSRHDFG